jgi:hypothetical protein
VQHFRHRRAGLTLTCIPPHPHAAAALQTLGYSVSYQQAGLTEYPFAISNLATDLRDGLRLCRLAEILTGAPPPPGPATGPKPTCLGGCLPPPPSPVPTPPSPGPAAHLPRLRHATAAGDRELLGRARYPSDKRPLQCFNTDLALRLLRDKGSVNLKVRLQGHTAAAVPLPLPCVAVPPCGLSCHAQQPPDDPGPAGAAGGTPGGGGAHSRGPGGWRQVGTPPGIMGSGRRGLACQTRPDRGARGGVLAGPRRGRSIRCASARVCDPRGWA